MQALLNSQKKKNQTANPSEPTTPSESKASAESAESGATQENVERPIGERSAEPEAATQAEQAAPSEPALTPKQQRREERKKLLESLLNPDAGKD